MYDETKVHDRRSDDRRIGEIMASMKAIERTLVDVSSKLDTLFSKHNTIRIDMEKIDSRMALTERAIKNIDDFRVWLVRLALGGIIAALTAFILKGGLYNVQ